MHFDEEMGFQFLGPRSTVLSPSDPRPPTVGTPTSIVNKSDRAKQPFSSTVGHSKGTNAGATTSWKPDPT